MSLRNITLGLFFAMGILAGGLAVWWRWSFSPQWILLGIAILGGLAISIPEERRRHLFLQRFWRRTCSGIRWRRGFPDATAYQIREFLDLFVAAFAFPKKRRLSFMPDDKVMEIYRGLYPDKLMPDCLELETLASRLRERYGIDANAFWREDITLGELFTHTRMA
jgi:hypothetical protein